MRLLLLFLLLFSCPLAAEDFYLELVREAMDDPALAKKKAMDVLQAGPIDVRNPQWLQAYLYMVGADTDALGPELGKDEVMRQSVEGARSLGQENLAQTFAYQLERSMLQARNAGKDEWTQLNDRFLELAEKTKNLRLAVLILKAKSFNAYNAGDMKTALSLTQRAIKLIDKSIPYNDQLMLTLRLDSAMFLEYANDREKSIEIYYALVADLKTMKARYTMADVEFNFALALMNAKRFPEAQKIFQNMYNTGITLNSKILQGRALKGLGYAQQRNEFYKSAVESYQKGIALMTEMREDPVAIADTYRLMGTCYTKDKQWANALRVLEIAAREPTAMSDKSWAKLLHADRAESYAGLGRYQEAFQEAMKVNTYWFEVTSADRESELNKLKVSMGLQLEEQQNALLKEQLKNADTIRGFFFGLLALSALVIVLLGVALLQTLKIKKSRERVHRILEHIEEGIISIGAGMKVEADLSPYLARLLGFGDKKVASFNIFAALLEVADLQVDERATIRAALSTSLGEDALNWELNLAQLPLELTIQQGSKHLSLEWQPIFESERVQNILLTVRDVTARQKLQNEVLQAKALASRMEQRLADILQIDARSAESFVNEARHILPELRPRIEQSRELTLCYRQLHTLKGMARSLGFKEMSSLVHIMEDQLDLEKKTLKNKEEALRILDEIENTVNEYREIIEKVFFRQSEAKSQGAESLIDLVAISMIPVRTMLERAGLELGAVDVQDHVQHWNRQTLDAVQILLLHGMTNSADHGFILPRRKGRSVERQAALTIKAWQTAEAIHIELADNGVGVDLEALGAMAARVGFVPSSTETVADVVFVDGLSTAEQVSTSSGRGMGLSALRHSINALEGTVNFKPNPAGRGGCLTARIPLSIGRAA